MSAKDEQLRKECVKLVSDRAEYSMSEIEILRRARALANYIKDGTVPLVIEMGQHFQPAQNVFSDKERYEGEACVNTCGNVAQDVEETDGGVKSDGNDVPVEVRDASPSYYQDEESDLRTDGNNEDVHQLQDYINRSLMSHLEEDERVRLIFDFLEMEVGLEFTRVRREWLEAIVRGQEVRYKYGPRR